MKYLVFVPENFTNNKGLVDMINGKHGYVNEYELSVIIQYNVFNNVPLLSTITTPPVREFLISKDQELTVLDDILIVKVGAFGYYPLSKDGLKETLNNFSQYLSDVSPSKNHLRVELIRKIINNN